VKLSLADLNGKGGIICDYCSAFTAGNILRGVEREDGGGGTFARKVPVASPFETVSAILDQGNASMGTDDILKALHIAHLAVKVDRDDRPRSGCDRSFSS